MIEKKSPNAFLGGERSGGKSTLIVKDEAEFHNRSLNGQLLTYKMLENVCTELQTLTGVASTLLEEVRKNNSLLRDISKNTDNIPVIGTFVSETNGYAKSIRTNTFTIAVNAARRKYPEREQSDGGENDDNKPV